MENVSWDCPSKGNLVPSGSSGEWFASNGTTKPIIAFSKNHYLKQIVTIMLKYQLWSWISPRLAIQNKIILLVDPLNFKTCFLKLYFESVDIVSKKDYVCLFK